MKIIQMMKMTRTQTTDRHSMANRQPHGIKTYDEHVFSQEARLQDLVGTGPKKPLFFGPFAGLVPKISS